MKKFFSKKVAVILGSALLVTGLVAIPVLAASSNEGSQNIFGQRQSRMSQTFAPGQHQEIMNSSVMQDLHNSDAMQEAMQSGDITKMQEVMNSNPEVKALLGEETLNKMSQFMGENLGAMDQMMNPFHGNEIGGQGRMGLGSGMMGSNSVR